MLTQASSSVLFDCTGKICATFVHDDVIVEGTSFDEQLMSPAGVERKSVVSDHQNYLHQMCICACQVLPVDYYCTVILCDSGVFDPYSMSSRAWNSQQPVIIDCQTRTALDIQSV